MGKVPGKPEGYATAPSAIVGGKEQRFRDVEIGDVDGDGQDELVVVTHDPEIMIQTERCIYLRDGLLHDMPESLTRLWDEQHAANETTVIDEKEVTA